MSTASLMQRIATALFSWGTCPPVDRRPWTASRRAAPMVGLVAALGVTSAASPALAVDPPVTRAAMADDVRGYYGGEGVAAGLVLSLGAAATAGGAILVTRGGDFARGLGWPLWTLGALESVGAVVYLASVLDARQRNAAAFARDPAAFQRVEGEHIHGTTSRFVAYRAIELGLTVAGAAIAGVGLATRHDAVTGAGLGVATIALPVFLIDLVNQARAARYEDHIHRFDPVVGVGFGDRGPVLSLHARF